MQSRLLDATSGFNYWINQVVQGGNYPSSALVAAGVQTGSSTGFQFGSGNLFLGNLSVDLIAPSGCGTYPIGQLYSVKGHGQGLVTPSEFSGPTLTMLKVTIGWGSTNPPVDTESPKAAILDAMLATFNAEEYNNLTPRGVVYNNQLAYEFEDPVKQEGIPSYRQACYFALTHNVITGANG